MNATDESAMIEQLREALHASSPDGPGPDLTGIRRRGAARRRRRHSAAAGALLVISGLALAGPSVLPSGADTLAGGFAGPGATTGPDGDGRSPLTAPQAQDVFHRALDRAGIAYPAADIEPGERGVWALSWRETGPGAAQAFQVTVYPSTQDPQPLNPCQNGALTGRSRGCTSEALPGGVRLFTFEEPSTPDPAARAASTWAPNALAVHSDGSWVHALAVSEPTAANETGGDVEPLPYTGPVTRDQLSALVTDPRLADASDG
jgi:hypothetical protein